MPDYIVCVTSNISLMTFFSLQIKMCFMDLDAIFKDLKKSDLTPLTTAVSFTN